MNMVVLFLILAIIMAIVGFSGVVVGAIVGMFKFLFVVFVFLCVVSLLFHLTRKPNPPARMRPPPPSRR